MQGFLDALLIVAGHPLALVGYVGVVAAWAFAVYRQGRLRALGNILGQLPESERGEALARELSVQPRSGLSAEQWLENRKRGYLLVAFLATLVVLVLIVALTLYRTTTHQPDKSTDLSLSAAFTADPSSPTRGTVRAVVTNDGEVTAQDVAIEIVLGESLQLSDPFWGPTEHVQRLPPQISQTATWDVVLSPDVNGTIEVRCASTNSEPISTLVAVPRVATRESAALPLGFSSTELEALPSGSLAFLRRDTPELIIGSVDGVVLQSHPLPFPCSAATKLHFDAVRDLLWIVCKDSSRVVAIRPSTGESVPVPEFPLVLDENDSQFARNPYSLVSTRSHILCTSTDGEQCLWALRWPGSSTGPSGDWEAVPYDEELMWTDAALLYTPDSDRVMLLHNDVIPASVSWFQAADPSGGFVTLGGHDVEAVGGTSAIAPAGRAHGFLCDEYGEWLRLVSFEGVARASMPLTVETDWSDGTRKESLIAVDAPQNRVFVCVTTRTPTVATETTVFLGNLDRWSAPERIGFWTSSIPADCAQTEGSLLVLCTRSDGASELRRVRP